MLNTIDTTKKSTKSKIIKQEFAIIILTTSTTLKNSKKIATLIESTILKELTTLKKSIKLEKIRIEDIQFMLKEELIYF